MMTPRSDAPAERAGRRRQARVTHGGPPTTGPDWFALLFEGGGLMPFRLGAFAPICPHSPQNGMAAPVRGFG